MLKGHWRDKRNRMKAQAPMGIIMLDTQFPRIPGDAGGAETWDFPVIYKVVKGITPQFFKEDQDKKLLKVLQDAAQELEREGVAAITSTCGLLAIYQQEIAETVKIPVLISSLLQIPLAYHLLSKDQKVGVITIDSRLLGQEHLKAIGGVSIPIAIIGLESGQELNCAILENKKELNIVQAEQDMVGAARRLVEENPTVGAIVLECANMAPYATAVQEAVCRPVFDITTLANFIYQSLYRQRFF